MGRNRGANNVRVNEVPKRKDFNVKEDAFAEAYDRIAKLRQPSSKRAGSNIGRIRRAQRTADDLVRKFGPGAKSSYRYFCKLAYNLPQSVIWDCYESSCKIGVINKLAYFLAATKAQLQMR